MEHLTAQDLQSPVWRKVAAILKARRLEHLEMLVAPGLDAADTELLRGRIAEIDSMLTLSRRASGGSHAPLLFGTEEFVSDVSKGHAP